MNRQPRDTRSPDDERDKRDVRRPEDPRDARDPRLPGDPLDARASADAGAVDRAAGFAADSSRFVKWVVSIIAVGLASVAFTAWQTTSNREDYERLLCQQMVGERRDNRDMWLWLGEKFPEAAIEIGLREQLNTRIPPLTCINNIPTPITTPEE